jgi:hypothetical protein
MNTLKPVDLNDITTAYATTGGGMLIELVVLICAFEFRNYFNFLVGSPDEHVSETFNIALYSPNMNTYELSDK